jgi:glutamate--cysteine ligase
MVRAAIDRVFERRLAALVNSREAGLLAGGRRGLERETLRVTPQGRVSARPHPQALGSTLTNPHITTDYSESLLELVTPTFNDNAALLQYLSDLHHFVYQHLGDELLWAASMPGEIAGEEEIPIARYGRSHRGRFKEVYRRGLQTRYGGLMQAIAGAHFNYSFPTQFWPLWAELCAERNADAAFVSRAYFDVLRNLRRHGWLVLYLFGASPALCASFLQGRADPELRPLHAGTLHLPYATSLRMSDLGYRNRNQSGVEVSCNALDEYLRDLRHATHTVHPPFAALGVCVDGEYRQLNANVLQIDNEYYSTIRPKRVPAVGESQSSALARAGVEYLEVRSLDLCVFEPVGACADELHITEALLAHCLLRASAPIGATEQHELEHNHLLVARRGRTPGLMLDRDGRAVALSDWAAELLDSLQGVCELLDHGNAARRYQGALARQLAKLGDPELTPSARLLRELKSADGDFAAYTCAISAQHRTRLLAGAGHAAAVQQQFAAEAAESLIEQAVIERADRGSFEEYLRRTLGPDIA